MLASFFASMARCTSSPSSAYIEKHNDRLTKMYFRSVWNSCTVVPSCVCEVLSIVKACACTWNTHACLRLVQFHLCRFTCRSTNMRGNQALLQILQTQSRLSTLTHLEVVPALQEVTCSNCQGKGHHLVTCKSYCRCFRYEPYCWNCRHLGMKPRTTWTHAWHLTTAGMSRTANICHPQQMDPDCHNVVNHWGIQICRYELYCGHCPATMPSLRDSNQGQHWLHDFWPLQVWAVRVNKWTLLPHAMY